MAEAKELGASEALTSSAAFEAKKGAFDVVLNCASANIDGSKVRVCIWRGSVTQATTSTFKRDFVEQPITSNHSTTFTDPGPAEGQRHDDPGETGERGGINFHAHNLHARTLANFTPANFTLPPRSASPAAA